MASTRIIKQNNKQRAPWRVVLAAGIAILLVVAIATMPTFDGSTYYYMLVMDAGSTGTRMYAFRYQYLQASGLPDLEMVPSTAAPWHYDTMSHTKSAYTRIETQPGLDEFTGDMQGLQHQALEPLLTWAKHVVPPAQWATTPLYCLATGGLRSLGNEQRWVVLTAVREILLKSGFWFKPSWARVVEPSDEAVFNWLALNYNNGRLGEPTHADLHTAKNSLPNHTSTGTPLPPTMGVLDMGGASLEVAYEDTNTPVHNESTPDTVAVPLGPVTYTLRMVLLHNHGLDSAWDRAVQALLPDAQSEDAGGAKRQQHTKRRGGRVRDTDAQLTDEEKAAAAQAARQAIAAMQTTQTHARAAAATSTAQQVQEGVVVVEEDTKIKGEDTKIKGETQQQEQQQQQPKQEEQAVVGDTETAVAPNQSAVGSAAGATGAGGTGENIGGAEEQAHEQQQQQGSQGTTHEAATTATTTTGEPVLDSTPAADASTATSGTSDSGAHVGTSTQGEHVGTSTQGVDEHDAAGQAQATGTSTTSRRLLQDTTTAARATPADASLTPSGASSTSLHDQLHTLATTLSISGQATLNRKSNDYVAKVPHPCLHKGYESLYHRTINRDASASEVLLMGRPSWTACNALAERTALSNLPSTISNLTTTPVFHALTGFHMVGSFFDHNPSNNLPALLAATETHCGLHWNEVQAQYSTRRNRERYCFRGAYVLHVMFQALGLRDSQVVLGDGTESWSLGAALTEGYKLGLFERLPVKPARHTRRTPTPPGTSTTTTIHSHPQGGYAYWCWLVLLVASGVAACRGAVHAIQYLYSVLVAGQRVPLLSSIKPSTPPRSPAHPPRGGGGVHGGCVPRVNNKAARWGAPLWGKPKS